MLPLWQYLAPFVIARRAHGCPQRARIVGPLGRSFLQISRFLGVRNGSHDAVPGPSPIARHSSAISVGVAVMGARAMPPFVAVLLASAKADEPIAAPKGARITDQTFPPANLPPLWQYFSVSRAFGHGLGTAVRVPTTCAT